MNYDHQQSDMLTNTVRSDKHPLLILFLDRIGTSHYSIHPTFFWTAKFIFLGDCGFFSLLRERMQMPFLSIEIVTASLTRNSSSMEYRFILYAQTNAKDKSLWVMGLRISLTLHVSDELLV